ncbi:hypothetical protein C8Q76DRAFT_289517 [Earliella scabrosa]|nr:hypothetical protein C8Q76DRAFT_289517 [Earliella scabrosa]
MGTSHGELESNRIDVSCYCTLPERAVARARQALARAFTYSLTHPDVNLLLAAPALPERVRASSSVYVYYTVSGLRERAVFLRAATRRARSPRGASTLRCSRRRPCARGMGWIRYSMRDALALDEQVVWWSGRGVSILGASLRWASGRRVRSQDGGRTDERPRGWVLLALSIRDSRPGGGPLVGVWTDVR